MAINGDRDQLSKASVILNLLATSAAEKPWWGVREIAKCLGFSPTTIHRTLVALADIGYTRQDPGSGRYAIGTELRRIAAHVNSSDRFAELSRPALQQLTLQTGETSVLARLDEITRSLVFVALVPGQRGLDYDIPLHKHMSLYRGASGLSVLAHMPLDDGPLQHDLRTVLHGIRSNGVALTRGDRIPGAVGISSAVLGDDDSVLGSVTLSIPETRMPSADTHHNLSLLVRECASQIRRRVSSACAQRPPA